MWDVKKFKEKIKNIKDSHMFNGQRINSREQIYRIIADNLYISLDTVKGWTRPNSNGPGDVEIKKALESFLDVEQNYFEGKEQKIMKNKEITNLTLNDFSKKAIWDCYSLIMDYLHDEDYDQEECFATMSSNLIKYKIAIPGPVYDMIDEYVDEHLAPIVYEPEQVFDIKKHEEELIEISKKSDIHSNFRDPDYRYFVNHLMVHSDIENEFVEFAMKNLYPLLVS